MNFSDSLLKIKRRKLPHWELDGSVYFITFNTYQHLELNPPAREIVLNCCLFFDESRHQNDKRYHTFAIVIMPDHVHWLMQPLCKCATRLGFRMVKPKRNISFKVIKPERT